MEEKTEITILKEEKINGSIIAYDIEPPYPLPDHTCFGIDPGTVHMGIAVLHQNSAQVYKIKMIRLSKALDRMLEVREMLTRCIGWFGYSPSAIIEGATFVNTHRQVELAEVRASIALWFYKHNVEVDIVPPKRIRKVSFGNGNIKNPWSNIDDDIAAALGCAYYPTKIDTISSTDISLTGK